MLAAGGPGPVGGLAQIAPRRERQERLDRRARQGDDVFAVEPPLARRFRCSVVGELGQALEIGLVEHQPPLVLVVLHVLAEMRVQRRHARGDLGHSRFLGGAEQRPRPDKLQMVPLQ